MNPLTHRKCLCCNGTGLVALHQTDSALKLIDEQLQACNSLREKIIVAVGNRRVSIDFIKALLTRHDADLDADLIHYTVLNLEDEGQLLYNAGNGKYIVNKEPYNDAE